MPAFSSELLGGFDKLIMDPVHGGIPVHAVELDAIDHPLFQRLRTICQNDILSLVFPGATHSRFLHSIGAMHVAGRMFRAMLSARFQQVPEATPQDQVPLAACQYFLRCARLASLLHDCGHSSFSHQFTLSARVAEMMAQASRFERLWQGADPTPFYRQQPSQLEHEHYSVRTAWQILCDIDADGRGVNAHDVLGVMETTEVEPSPLFRQHAKAFWLFVTGQPAVDDPLEDHQVALLVQDMLSSIVSGEVDADRADYMLRDGFHSSVSFGSYNLDHLLSNFRIGWQLRNEHGQYQPWLGLAITGKGLGALEDFVYSRYQMYRQVYGHKTAIGFDWLLRQAIDEVMQHPDVYDRVDQCLSDLTAFQYLTDSYFWEQFRHKARLAPQSYSAMVVNRTRLKHLGSRRSQSASDIEANKAHWARQVGVEPDAVVHAAIKARFTKVNNRFDRLRVMLPSNEAPGHRIHMIQDVTDFFDRFTDEHITHFYLRPF